MEFIGALYPLIVEGVRWAVEKRESVALFYDDSRELFLDYWYGYVRPERGWELVYAFDRYSQDFWEVVDRHTYTDQNGEPLVDVWETATEIYMHLCAQG